jgi:hypothetical protein
MLLVDTETKALIQDVELKGKISKSRPYGEWLQQQVKLTSIPPFPRIIFDEGTSETSNQLC